MSTNIRSSADRPAENSVAEVQHWVEQACVWEATARKPGNVYPGADLPGLQYRQLLAAGSVIAPILAGPLSVSASILRSVQATKEAVGTNANLGIILLLAPLSRATEAAESLEQILDHLTVADTAIVYEAIRTAHPGGLGEADQQDVHQPPTLPLRAAMALARQRDSIARQYADAFIDVTTFGAPLLGDYFGASAGAPADTWEEAVVWCHLRFLAAFPDSHIARRHGAEAAADVQRTAQQLVATLRHRTTGRPTPGWIDTPPVAAFDAWLRLPRTDGRSYNPGTTADLVAASIFWALRTRQIEA